MNVGNFSSNKSAKKSSRGTKTRQGAKKKKKNMNFINLQHNEPDFRDIPIPEGLEAPQVRYEPLDRHELSRQRRGLERANTLSHLHKLPSRPLTASESSFSLQPIEEINEFQNRGNEEVEEDRFYRNNFPSRFVGAPSNTNLNFLFTPRNDAEIPRFNPQSNAIEKYHQPSFLPDSFELPRVTSSMQALGTLILNSILWQSSENLD